MLIDHVIGGKYRITELIGQGGMGTVFEAVHNGTGSRVAIKLIVSTEAPAGKVAYLWWKNALPADASFRMSADPAVYARDLYAILHQLDALNFDVIVVEPVPLSEPWEGIRDRLKRASS